jgi:dihydroorotate dehydrogenase
VEDQAIVNRMGFPSNGSAAVIRRLRRLKRLNAILGVNLGKNSQTPNEEAVFDYLALLQNFAPLADYLAINVSSPNTVGLRQLQGRQALEALLEQLNYQRRIEQEKLQKRLPLLVKLAPDLSEAELDDALEAILCTGMDGVIVTNTSVERRGLRSRRGAEKGGLSGSPLRGRSEAVLRFVVERLGGRIPVVSVGGIMSPEDARRRLDMGAALVQIYTGLIYHGPGLVREIVRQI